MPGPRVYRTEAIVLKALDYGEADRILTLFSKNLGKVRAIAKGVRRTKSRKAGHLDLFTRSELLIAAGRELDVVTQAESQETVGAIRDDLRRLSSCHYVAELIDGFLPDRLPSAGVYSLAVLTFRRLATAEDVDLVLRSFELRLLELTGYRPQLHRCLECGEEIGPATNYLSPSVGGVLCPACAGADRTATEISVAALKVLRNLQTNEESMLRVKRVPAEVHREIEDRLQEYIVYRLEKRPRSIAFIERLRAEAGRA